MDKLQELRALAPWHQKLPLHGGVYTTDGNRASYEDPNAQNVSVVDAEKFQEFLLKFFPEGLKGKRFLDVGCNGGAYCIVAHQMGAGFALGFDPREHWIKQANYLKNYFNVSDEHLRFELGTIDSILPEAGSFDVTIFKGVFYHLPFPVESLLRLCASTKDFILIDSAVRNDIPEDCMAPKIESTTRLMSGVDGLSWYPGGAALFKKILRWAGFPYVKVTNTIKNSRPHEKREKNSNVSIGRIRLVASRKKEMLEGMKVLDD